MLRFLPRYILLILLMIPNGGGAVFAQDPMNKAPADITLQEVLRQTYESSPVLNAARAERRSIQEKLPQAWANFQPTIAAQAGVLTSKIEGNEFGFPGGGAALGAGAAQGAGTNADGTTSKEIALTVDQPLYRGGRSVAQLEAAKHLIEAQDAILLQTQQDVLLEAASVYMDVVRDQSLLELAQNNMNVISNRLVETQARFDAGELTLTDVAQAKARLAAGRANLMAAGGALRSSRARFERVAGFTPPPVLNKPLMFLEAPSDFPSLEALALRDNPALRAANSVYDASQSDADIAFGALLPEVGFTAQWAKTYDPQPGFSEDQENKSIGVNARIPLYQGGAARSRHIESLEISAMRREEAAQALDMARQNAVIAWEDFQSATSEIAARQAQVEAAALAREGVSAEEQVGARTILDTLDAEQEFLQARSDQIAAERNEIVARFSLAAIYGGLKPETLWLSGDAPLTGSHGAMIKRKILETNVDSFGNSD